jgi:hypothetical protein
MTDKQTANTAAGNAQKSPDDWVTGDEPMTGAQRSYLKTLSEEAKQPFDDSLSKARASQRIDELQQITGRGDASASAAGEEDPGAALDDPSTRDAMQGQARGSQRQDRPSTQPSDDATPKAMGDRSGGEPGERRS